jgi:hypothetical protein
MTLTTVTHIANLATWPLVLWLMLSKSGEHRPAKELSNGRVEFTPASYEFWLWLLAVIPLASTALATLRHGVYTPLDLLNSGVIIFLALSHLFMFPATIVSSREGLEQVYWLWKNRHIRWEEILEIVLDKKASHLTIKSGHGTRIVYSPRLAGFSRLLREIRQYCADNLPPEFPGEGVAAATVNPE